MRVNPRAALVILSVLVCLNGCSQVTPSGPATGGPGLSIGGMVLDEGGAAASGRQATLFEKNIVSRGPARIESVFVRKETTITDADGKFQFRKLPVGEYSVLIDGDGAGGFRLVRLRDTSEDLVVREKPYGSLSGRIPAAFLDRQEPLMATILEINRTLRVPPDGAVRFEGLPEGRYRLSLDLVSESIDYAERPLSVECSPGKETAFPENLFRPWSARLEPRFSADSDPRPAIAFGLVCTDSVAGSNRCEPLEREAALGPIPLFRYPTRASIPVELSLFDSTGSLVGEGRLDWADRDDSVLVMPIQ